MGLYLEIHRVVAPGQIISDVILKSLEVSVLNHNSISHQPLDTDGIKKKADYGQVTSYSTTRHEQRLKLFKRTVIVEKFMLINIFPI